jgi:hypothetical protein
MVETKMLTTKTASFDTLLLRSIDEALNSLGESVSQSIYFHIEDKFGIIKDEIPVKLQEFQEGLKEIFGAGAQFVEILIMKMLHMNVGGLVKIKPQQFRFLEYVDAFKKRYYGSAPSQTFESKPRRLSIFSVFTVSGAKL